jgi:ribosome-binding protein aMBF1 (putative translation factor)
MKTWKRAQVAKRIGKSVATVRRLEGIELFPTLDEGGAHRFDAAEVEALAARMDRARRPQSACSAPSTSGEHWRKRAQHSSPFVAT